MSEYFGRLDKYFKIEIFSIDEETFVVSFTDITDIKEQKDILLKLFQLERALNKVRTVLIEASDEKDLYQQICNALVQTDFIKIAVIALKQNGSSKIIVAPEEYESYIASHAELFLGPLNGGDFPLTLKSGKPLVLDNIRVQNLNIQSTLILPLIHEGRFWKACLLT
ncbi:MAG: GAF domain-containing protein [Thermotogaceae bacterium]|nr:GAF domain-containing protein [Thermotogaceae bacterium]